MATHDPDQLRVSLSGEPYAGRTDGVGVLTPTSGTTSPQGLVGIENGQLGQHIGDPGKWCQVFEDFHGTYLIADQDTPAGSSALAFQEVSGNIAIAKKEDIRSGAVEILADNTSEVQNLTLSFGDNLSIDSDLGPIMRCRLQYQTQPAAADSLCWGFGGPRNALMDSVANNAWFKIAGANDDLLVESDDATTNDDDNDTGVDMVAGTFMEFMVSMNAIHGASATDVRFFYRSTLNGAWTRVLDTTAFAFGANIQCQPYFQVEKTTGTTTPDMLIDYIHVMWLRE